jgi:hypothetical protein
VNSKQAKQLDFPELLRKMGHHPVEGGIKNGGRQLWYRSPLVAANGDRTPSLHLTKGSHVAWVFKCFSTGKEGTILDFVMAHEGYAHNDVSSALAFLREKFPGALFDYRPGRAGGKEKPTDLFSSHQPAAAPGGDYSKGLAADRNLEFLEDLPLTSGSLITYLEGHRKIPADLARKYLRLVRYKNLQSGKTFYAIGMKNRAGGFEVRAASDAYSFKSALIARDISVFRAGPPSRSALVYEGFMDFLAHLSMLGCDVPPCDAVVLHSVNSFRRAADYLKGEGHALILTLLDLDEAGQRCAKQFEAEFPGRGISFSHLLHPFKDVNECLQHGRRLPDFLDAPGLEPGFPPP